MIKQLELQLVKLESRRLADQKTLRISKASQTIEAEQGYSYWTWWINRSAISKPTSS